MLNEKMENALNNQINAEWYSAYFYMTMHAFFEKKGLKGFANWMNVQVQEEMAHARGLYDYVLTRGGCPKFEAIAKPEISEWECVHQVFEAVMKHEQKVTGLINNLADVADEVKDRAATSYIDWYIKEQVEEEDNVKNVLATLEIIGDDRHALLGYDKELATRVFNPPVIG